jgi:hypothetical protein
MVALNRQSCAEPRPGVNNVAARPLVSSDQTLIPDNVVRISRPRLS